MKALTLIRPWCWAIAHAGKRCENRGWRIPASACNVPIAIHSGAKWDEHASDSIARLTHDWPPTRMDWAAGRITCVAWFSGQNVFPSRWRAEDVANGWDISRVFVLPEPIEGVRGALGLWNVPPDVEARILAQIK